MHDSSGTKVLFLRQLPEQVMGYLREGLEGRSVDFITLPDDRRETLLAFVADSDVLIGWRSDLDMLEASRRLKLFINPGTGIQQHVENFRALNASRPVPLANGHGNSYAVAQHTVALLLSLTNKVLPHHVGMQPGTERVSHQRTFYLRKKTIGFLGYGEINTKVHRFLSGFEVSFAAFRRNWNADGTPSPSELLRFSEGELLAFFEACDVVINSLPDTTFTQGLVGMPAFKALGEQGLFLNVGRGNTVVEADLFQALQDRVIAGAALDVWWKRVPGLEQVEGTPYNFPYHTLDNLVMSPHRAADAGGDLDRWDEVIVNLKRIADGRTDFVNLVNLDREY